MLAATTIRADATGRVFFGGVPCSGQGLSGGQLIDERVEGVGPGVVAAWSEGGGVGEPGGGQVPAHSGGVELLDGVVPVTQGAGELAMKVEVPPLAGGVGPAAGGQGGRAGDSTRMRSAMPRWWRVNSCRVALSSACHCRVLAWPVCHRDQM
jgi:hypothetical protein